MEGGYQGHIRTDPSSMTTCLLRLRVMSIDVDSFSVVRSIPPSTAADVPTCSDTAFDLDGSELAVGAPRCSREHGGSKVRKGGGSKYV